MTTTPFDAAPRGAGVRPPASRRSLAALGLALAACLGACLDPDAPGNLVPRTVAEDPSLPRLEVNGTLLHAEAFGDPANPVVLVIHGGPGGDYRALLPLQALVDDGYRVVFWDQRGTGLSERVDASSFTWANLLEDFRQVVDHYTGGTRPVILVGHSWGAMYATWFIDTYGTYGGLVQGAVLSEPGAFTYAQLEGYMERLTAGIDYLDPEINDATWIGQVLSPEDHARADYMSKVTQGRGEWPALRCDPDDPEPGWRSGAVAAKTTAEIAERDGFDWTTHLKSFTPRVLFLRGDLNEANRIQDDQERMAAYANAEMVVMQDIGHCMIWERPAEYLQHVRDYFQSIGFAGGQP